MASADTTQIRAFLSPIVVIPTTYFGLAVSGVKYAFSQLSVSHRRVETFNGTQKPLR